VDAERKPLSGNVEVDEALVGGVQEGWKRGCGTTKSIVAIAVEIKQPKGFGVLGFKERFKLTAKHPCRQIESKI